MFVDDMWGGGGCLGVCCWVKDPVCVVVVVVVVLVFRLVLEKIVSRSLTCTVNLFFYHFCVILSVNKVLFEFVESLGGA